MGGRMSGEEATTNERRLRLYNRLRRLAFWVCIAALVILTLFPPFHYVLEGTEVNAGHAFILAPPDRYPIAQATITLSNLVVYWLILGFVAWLVRPRRSK